MKENMRLIGKGYFELRKKDGTIIDKWESNNLIVTSGKVQIANMIGGLETDNFNTIAIGEGTTEVLVGDTALETEVARAIADISYEATGKIVFEYTFDFGSAESYDITEAGILNSSSAGGVLLDRFVFSPKTVDVDINLYVKITITVS